MATKTISLELDAYERLKQHKRKERESFSEVVRRAQWPDGTKTGRDVLESLKKLMSHPEMLPTEQELDYLDRAQNEVRRSPSRWDT